MIKNVMKEVSVYGTLLLLLLGEAVGPEWLQILVAIITALILTAWGAFSIGRFVGRLEERVSSGCMVYYFDDQEQKEKEGA